MNDIRKSAIKKKIEEVKQLLEKWIKDDVILHPGEVLSLEIDAQIIQRPIVEVKLLANGKKVVNTDKEISAEDWTKILALPFREKLKRIVEVFSNNGNQPLLPEEIFSAMEKQKGYTKLIKGGYIFERDIIMVNSLFTRYGYPYRLRASDKRFKGKGSRWDTHPVKIYIVE